MSAGLVALLNEQSCAPFALKALHEQVDQYWSELADHLPLLEKMYLTNKVDDLALLISKIYFYLDVQDLSLRYALKSNLSDQSLFVKSIIQNAVETFITLSSTNAPIEPLLNDMIAKIIDNSFSSNDIDLVIILAIQSHNIPLIKRCISHSSTILPFIYATVLDSPISFRNTVLDLIVIEFVKSKDFVSSVQCYLHLNKPLQVSQLLTSLVESNTLLVAYQIAFDLDKEASQFFVNQIISSLKPTSTPFSNIISILNGTLSSTLYLEFMFRNNKGDVQLLKNINSHLDARSSIHHTALSIANAFMFAGTTYDQFLRDNLDWLSKASHWSKFTATAALGVIHKGQIKNSLTILEPYLPQESVSTQPHSEAGSLFALGLIHLKLHGVAPASTTEAPTKSVIDTVHSNLSSNNEVLQHGACLGLGCLLLATNDQSTYNDLRGVLFSDSAVAGHAAAISIGLVMLGSLNQPIITELIQYAHDTQHETIIRGISISIALLCYAQCDAASSVYSALLNDPDPILRQGGCYALGMAYSGNNNNHAIQLLLHVAVSDVNDNVRRASVISLGFIMFNNPQQLLQMIGLLMNSWHPHVRYASTLALGMVFSGTGDSEAISQLEPLLKDSVDFVRQGALISMGMLLMQHNETHAEYVKLHQLYSKIIGDKRENSMAKLGATMGMGILEAGGRNVSIQLGKNGHLNMNGIVGMLLFTQYWNWYPLSLFLSLSFNPTLFIGLNEKLEVPDCGVLVCDRKLSEYGYPEATKVVEKGVDHVQKTAVLSVSNKIQQRQEKQRRESTLNSPATGVIAMVFCGN